MSVGAGSALPQLLLCWLNSSVICQRFPWACDMMLLVFNNLILIVVFCVSLSVVNTPLHSAALEPLISYCISLPDFISDSFQKNFYAVLVSKMYHFSPWCFVTSALNNTCCS